MTHKQSIDRKGVSLTEVVMSSILVGGIVLGSMSMLGSSVRSQSRTNDMATGPLLAEALLSEILSMPYYDPETGSGSNSTNTGETTITRQDFDDVGDFDGWSTTTVQDRLGNPLPEYAGWSRAAYVKWGNRTTGHRQYLSDGGLKRIFVVVTAPDGTVTTRFAFRWKDGALEQKPVVDRTVVTRIETSISVGTPAVSATGVSNLLNHVEDPNG